MTLAERLKDTKRLFLDTAPVIYYVEANPRYLARVQECFDRLDSGTLTAVVSPITLAECVVQPLGSERTDLAQAFEELLTAGPATEFAVIDPEAAGKAAELRAKYNIPLLDAFQLALAVTTHCDAFLTNDVTLKRVGDVDVIVIDEIQATS